MFAHLLSSVLPIPCQARWCLTVFADAARGKMRRLLTPRSRNLHMVRKLLVLITSALLQRSQGFSQVPPLGHSWRRAQGSHSGVCDDKSIASNAPHMCAPGGGAQVALTRELGKNAKLASLLASAGVSTVEVPCICHQDGPDLRLLPSALADGHLAYVVITSPEAANVFVAGWEKAGRPAVPVACVGKATSESLQQRGVTPIFTPSKATGETLAAELPLPPARASDADESGTIPQPRVLYPASMKAQRTLESGLQARGFVVQRLNTYDTVPADWQPEAAVAAASVLVVAFGSPSAVKTWTARVGATKGHNGDVESRERGTWRGGALAACIGETSARACRESGWTESTIFYPENPGVEGWAQAVFDALATVEAASQAGAAA